MDELLSEQEQIEKVRGWIRSNTLPLFGGVILGLGIVFGWDKYEDYELNRSIDASNLYQELSLYVSADDDAEAINIFEQLKEEYASSPYTDQAALLVTVMYLNNQNYSNAIESLLYVLDNTTDEYLSIIARIRLIRVYIEQGSFNEAEALFIEEVPGEFMARFDELRGDIYASLENKDAARSSYTKALNSDSQLINRALIQMKIDDLDVSLNLEEDI